MRLIRLLTLYLALLTGANAVMADTATLEALRDGDMKKLSFHAEPQPGDGLSYVAFEDPFGTVHEIVEFAS